MAICASAASKSMIHIDDSWFRMWNSEVFLSEAWTGRASHAWMCLCTNYQAAYICCVGCLNSWFSSMSAPRAWECTLEYCLTLFLFTICSYRALFQHKYSTVCLFISVYSICSSEGKWFLFWASVFFLATATSGLFVRFIDLHPD